MPDCHGKRVVAVRVEVRVLLDGDEVLDVRDRGLVELLGPALLEHQPEVAVVVGQHDDVAVDRLPARERALDLPEERGVVVDVLDVVDVDAGLLLELVERRVRLRLVVGRCRASSSRSGGSWRASAATSRRAAGRLRPAAAAGGQEAGDRDRGSADSARSSSWRRVSWSVIPLLPWSRRRTWSPGSTRCRSAPGRVRRARCSGRRR